MSDSILDHILEERKFLHDLSNKLVVVQGMGSFISKSLANSESCTEKDLDRSEKLKKATAEMINLISKRRELLHSLSED